MRAHGKKAARTRAYIDATVKALTINKPNVLDLSDYWSGAAFAAYVNNTSAYYFGPDDLKGGK